MVILCIICVYPLLYVLFASFSDPSQLAAHRGLLVKPLGFTFKGYEMVLQNQNILTGYANTLFYVVVGTFVNIMATSVAAYLMSRKRWAWSVPLMMMATFYMFFKGGLIPSYLLVKDLGLMNTRWALIIPSAITVWNLIILRTAFASVPDALEESARIDGASELRILFNIIIPVSKAAIAVQVLYYAVWHWNEWF